MVNIGRPLYIIDGYNVVFNSSFYSRSKEIEILRRELIGHLDNYRTKRNVDIVVVWDGNDGNLNLQNEQTHSRVKSLFSRNPENADSKIVKMVAKYDNRSRIIVVSNDRRHIVTVVKNMGAKTMSVEKFLSIIGYHKTNRKKGSLAEEGPANAKADESIEKLGANDLTIEEWLRIFKSKKRKGD